MRKAIVAIALAVALLAPATAQAFSLKRFVRVSAFSDAKSLANHTRDAERYGVGHCAQFDASHAKCIGVVIGHSINPADPAQTPLSWTCKFIERGFLNLRTGRARARIGALQCHGAGEPYIQRHS